MLQCDDVEVNPGPAATEEKQLKKNQLNMIHTIHANPRSLLKHFDNVASLVTTEQPHILARSETWLDSSVSDQETHLPEYSVYRFDHKHCGGGVAIYCSNELPCSPINCGTCPSGVEFL